MPGHDPRRADRVESEDSSRWFPMKPVYDVVWILCFIRGTRRRVGWPSQDQTVYLIPILSKALDVIELLEQDNASLTLEDVYQRTNISKTSVYRI